MKGFLKNWKTTASGVGMIVTTVAKPKFWQNPEDIALLIGAVGLMFSKDMN